MLVQQHFILGLILSVLLFYRDFFSGIIFLACSVCIDIDNAFSYWYYTKHFTYSYKKIKHWCLSNGNRLNIFLLFHNIWFIGIIFLLSLNFSIFYIALFGFCFHYFCDIIWDYYRYSVLHIAKKPYRRWLF